MRRTPLSLAALPLCVVILGCERGQRSPDPPGPPKVIVSQPIVKEITDCEEFTGHTEAVATVDIRARVTGYLEEDIRQKKKEGKEVKEGELLFKIDRRIYKAERDRAQATLEQSKRHRDRLELDYKRAKDLLPGKGISQEEFDKIEGDLKEADSAVGIAQAALDLAKLNLEFTEVKAPFDGRVSRQAIDPGNIVKADETVLTTIVALDPIYAYFDVDERTMLRVRRLILEGKVKSSSEATLPVLVGLADEVDEKGNPLFPHAGTINFVDNRVDVTSGTLRLRGVFSNPPSEHGPNRIFSPGMFVRVRLPIGQPRSSILISERALASDQGQAVVYVVNDKNEVEYRPVSVGAKHDGLIAVQERDGSERKGLARGERIIVRGLQRVNKGSRVTPELIDMPLDGAPSAPPLATDPGSTSRNRPSS
jgi:RND family efflux transporter MFP subunit